MSHRPTQSNGEGTEGKDGEKVAVNVFDSPPRNEGHRPKPRPRRNSDSSMFDAKEEDRRRRERRRRERDARERAGRDGKERGDSKDRRPKHRVRRPQGLDIIDKLDVTGLYGPSMVHHDGPFDACNPHRNKKNARAAPMQAFPDGSLNNVLGGSGPVNKKIDLDALHGRAHEGFADYNVTKRIEPQSEADPSSKKPTGAKSEERSFNAKELVEPVHGEASAGLGTSTFFEGTQVPRSQMTRRESESENTPLNPIGGGGLSRKRSIAQKIRGMSRQRPGMGGEPGVTSPDGRYVRSPTSPQEINGVQSAGGRSRMNEQNPFFQEQDPKKPPTSGVLGRPRTASSPNRTRAPSSPKRPLDRLRTSEDDYGMPAGKENASSGGIIGRVKSLRGKKRPERFAAGAANA